MAMSSQLFALKQGINVDKIQRSNALRRLKQKQAGRDMFSNLALLALTVGTGGAGLPTLLSKIPAIGKAIQSVPALGKLMTVLDATKKTSRLGVFGTKMLNKVIHRGIADAIAPDVYQDAESGKSKLNKFMQDILVEGAGYSKSWLPDAENPYTQLPWGQSAGSNMDIAQTVVDQGGPALEETAKGTSKLLKASQESPEIIEDLLKNIDLGAGESVEDPRERISMFGGDYATTPGVTKGLFGNPITQKPSGYSRGNPYYELMNMISD